METVHLTPEQIAHQYFEDINGHRQPVHVVMRNMSIQESKAAAEEDIRSDAALWYAGFSSHHEAAKTAGTLPSFDSVFPVIHKNFATRVKYAPAKV